MPCDERRAIRDSIPPFFCRTRSSGGEPVIVLLPLLLLLPPYQQCQPNDNSALQLKQCGGKEGVGEGTKVGCVGLHCIAWHCIAEGTKVGCVGHEEEGGSIANTNRGWRQIQIYTNTNRGHKRGEGGGSLKREDLKSRCQVKMCGVSISVSLCLRDVPLLKRGGERSLVEMWGVSVCPLLCLDWYVGMGP